MQVLWLCKLGMSRHVLYELGLGRDQNCGDDFGFVADFRSDRLYLVRAVNSVRIRLENVVEAHEVWGRSIRSRALIQRHR